MALSSTLGDMPKRIAILLTLATLGLIGCRGTSINRLVQESYPAHQERVCVLEGVLPESIPHVAVANVTVKPRGYGGDRKAKRALGNVARQLGAHVVQQTSFGNTMGAAEGTGVAVVVTAQASLPDECEWY